MGVEDVLGAVLGTLSDQQLAVFQARSEKLTFPMIGEMLGISPRAAQHSYERAQANIGKALLPLAYEVLRGGCCDLGDVKLRPATQSRFKGVTRRKASGKWIAQMKVGKRSLWLGQFDNEVAAARAFDAATLRHNGPAAMTNETLGRYEASDAA